MTDPEKAVLKLFADNPLMVAVVKDAIYKQFDFGNVSNEMTNENIGQVVRARIDGRILVDRAFQFIEQQKTVSPKSVEENPAR